jgi:hypothetical protein
MDEINAKGWLIIVGAPKVNLIEIPLDKFAWEIDYKRKIFVGVSDYHNCLF